MSLIFLNPLPPTTSLADLFTEREMQTLWTHINTLFFGISIPSKLKVFQWTSPSDEKDVLGVASKGRFRYYIKMSPVYLPHHGSDGLMNRILDMLSTLLHEACHVFFRYTTCPCCSTFTRNLHNARGHRRAWQVLAEAVERCFTRFTGLPVELVELGRWVSICCNWKDMVRLPSRHEVGDWKLDRDGEVWDGEVWDGEVWDGEVWDGEVWDGEVWEYEEGLQMAVEQWVGYGETDLEAFRC
jgi:hypothetical protein